MSGGRRIEGVPNVEEAWPLWRLVVYRIATLEELDRHYSLNDLADANEALDAKILAETPPPAETR